MHGFAPNPHPATFSNLCSALLQTPSGAIARSQVMVVSFPSLACGLKATWSIIDQWFLINLVEVLSCFFMNVVKLILIQTTDAVRQ